jgi:hypothetical protein
MAELEVLAHTPEITPAFAEVVTVRHEGSVPVASTQVYGVVPPSARMLQVYWTVVNPALQDCVGIDTAAEVMVIVNGAAAQALAVSHAWKVKV